MGLPEPRLFTPPLRPLTRKTSRGYEVADFAERVLGEPLLPWQRWFAIHALELDPESPPRRPRLRFRVVVLLVARQNGKTRLVSTMSLWRMFVDRAKLVLSAAQDLSVAREVWQDALGMIRGVPDLHDELAVVRGRNGDEWFGLTNGARWKIVATNVKAGRGLSVDQLDFDEVRTQQTWDAWSALSKTTQAKSSGLTLCASNAGDDRSVVLNGLRDGALAGRDETVGLFEWSGEDGCDLDDPGQWRQANPALGHLIDERAIRSSLSTDPPEVFRSEVLCQRVTSLDSAVDGFAWRDCRDQSLQQVSGRVFCAVDVSEDGAHVTLAAAVATDDGRVKVVPVNAWRSTAEARRELQADIERIGPELVGWYPAGPAAALAPLLQSDKCQPIRGNDVTAACMGLADLVAARRLVHPGEPLLDAHVAGASKLWSGDGWRFGRRGLGQCDAAYAAAGAVWLAQTTPEPKVFRPAAMAV